MEQVVINYGIQSVRETEYFIDESVEIEQSVTMVLNASLTIKVPLEEVHFTITANYRNRNVDFLRGKTTTIFLVQNLKDRSKIVDAKELVDLPDPLWITLFSISFTHARAMLARSSAGSKFGQFILPIINPEEQFRLIFKAELEKNRAMPTEIRSDG